MLKIKRLPFLVLATLSLLSTSTASAAEPRPSKRSIERGRYLVSIMGCHDCHTPLTMGPEGPMPDMTRALSGHPESFVIGPRPPLDDRWVWAGAATNTAFVGPWGTSFAANLTPDPETGLLSHWTEVVFIQALRTGRHEGRGRPILPPMPWPAYRNATDADLKAVFAYLRSLPPVSNRVPQPLEPPAPTPAH